MTNEQAVAKLLKTRKSLSTALYYGHTLNGSKVQILVDRYETLRALLAETTAGWEAWKAMCSSLGSDPRHDGYDLLA